MLGSVFDGGLFCGEPGLLSPTGDVCSSADDFDVRSRVAIGEVSKSLEIWVVLVAVRKRTLV